MRTCNSRSTLRELKQLQDRSAFEKFISGLFGSDDSVGTLFGSNSNTTQHQAPAREARNETSSLPITGSVFNAPLFGSTIGQKIDGALGDEESARQYNEHIGATGTNVPAIGVLRRSRGAAASVGKTTTPTLQPNGSDTAVASENQQKMDGIKEAFANTVNATESEDKLANFEIQNAMCDDTPVVKSIGRVDTGQSPDPGLPMSLCDRARDARKRNSPAASNLEAQCLASGGKL